MTRASMPSPAQPPVAEVRRARRVFRTLADRYPDAHCELDHRNPFELLCATILSAQCTDARVNQVTPALFARYPTPAALAAAAPADVEALVRTTGFYRNKAASLIEASRGITERFGGEVPRAMDDLLTLRGVARKTANVILGNAYNLNHGVVVDTHVGRLARRLGFTTRESPVHVEQDLMALFPRRDWCLLSHLLIFHGRRTCAARKPRCSQCPLAARDCPRRGVDASA